jgi:hypothetical protein
MAVDLVNAAFQALHLAEQAVVVAPAVETVAQSAQRYFTALDSLADAALPNASNQLQPLQDQALALPVDPVFALSYPTSAPAEAAALTARFNPLNEQLAGLTLPTIQIFRRTAFEGLIHQITQFHDRRVTAAQQLHAQHVGHDRATAVPVFVVRGPVGVGKSHALLYDTTLRRRLRAPAGGGAAIVRDRVVVIPHCGVWRRHSSPSRFFIDALITAFCDQAASVNLCETTKSALGAPNITAVQEEQIVMRLLHVLLTKVVLGHAEAQVYMYFDQHQSLPDSDLDKFPFSLAGRKPIPGFAFYGGTMVFGCVGE